MFFLTKFMSQYAIYYINNCSLLALLSSFMLLFYTIVIVSQNTIGVLLNICQCLFGHPPRHSFAFSLANMATPLTIFYWRVLPFSGAFMRNPVFTCLGALSIILSAAYSIWFFIV
jgi:NADH:ubiquinone oxidoreductase subunit 4 (subunit M)